MKTEINSGVSKNKLDTKIIIATHKKYDMSTDSIYLPLHVGREGKQDLGYIGDDTGENISIKNPYFCELTGLYWAWKNLSCDYVGLVHYRRYFSTKGLFFRITHSPKDSILTSSELGQLIPKYKIIVPKKRRYYIETLYSHYEHTHYKEHLDIVREIISEKQASYLNEFDIVMKQSYGYMFNMYIMEKELSDEYCKWLFDILFELETKVNSSDYSDFQSRFYGRVSEILFNVWLKHINAVYKEIPHIHIEKINWVKKGKAFMAAKFKKRKYEGSF